MDITKLTKPSIKQIQIEYYELLIEIFGDFFTKYKKNKDVFYKELNQENLIKTYIINKEKIEYFWKKNNHILEDIKNLKERKVILTGDLFNNNSNPFQKYAFSSEVILLSDPLLKSWIPITYEIENFGWKRELFNLSNNLMLSLINTIELLEINKNLNKEVIIFYPFPENNVKKEEFNKVSDIITLNKVNEIYSKKFESYEELELYASKINDINELKENIFIEDNLIYDLDRGNNSNINQLDNFILNKKEMYPNISLGLNFIWNINSRTMQSLDAIIISQNLNSSNIMESFTSNKHLKWTLENINNKSQIKTNTQYKTEAIQTLKHKFDWFENYPIDILIELHKEGFIFEIQNLFNNMLEKIYKENNIQSREKLILEFQKEINKRIKTVEKKFDAGFLFWSKKIIEVSIASLTDFTLLKTIGIGLDVADKTKNKNKEEKVLYKFINLGK